MSLRVAFLSMTMLIGMCGGTQADLLLCGKCINSTRQSASGLDTADAKMISIVTAADVKSHCENWEGSREGLARCIANGSTEEVGTRRTAAANCGAGEITNVDGSRYRFSGIWGKDEPSGVAEGEYQFRRADGSIVSTDHASGGRELATNFYLLCPKTDLTAKVEKVALRPSDTAEVLGEPYDHNGSLMTIAHQDGIIVYAKPKNSIRGTVKSGTVLFRGDMSSPSNVSGTAYTFKAGCAPAPYPVSGKFAGGQFAGTLTLKGKAPVRSKNGCGVAGYSAVSGNARLVFEYEAPSEL